MTYARIVWLTTVAAGAGLVVHAVAGATIDRPPLLLPVLALSIAWIGVALTTASAVLTAITQLSAPADIEGRILGFYALITLSTTTLGSLAIGGLDVVVSIWWVLAVAGGLVLTYGVLLGGSEAFAEFDRVGYHSADHAAFHHAHATRTAVAATTMPTTALPQTASRLGNVSESV
jgi:hypothetical protein